MNDAQPFRLFPHAASTLASEVDHVYLYTLTVSALFSTLLAALVIVFCVRYRRRAHAAVPPPPVRTDNRIEYAWIAALLGVFLTMFGWAAVVFAHLRDVPAGAMQVHVVAKQWMWKFQYPNGRRTIDELVVPLGRPVELVMTSEDVIHSLFVPAFRVKQDVLPFRTTQLWFAASRPGRYHLFCAEYCGTLHSRMIGWVNVMSQPEFARWLERGAPAVGPAATGEELFAQFGCAACHMQHRDLAPTLSGLYGRTVLFRDGTSHVADDAYIRESMLEPTAKIAAGYEPIMPSFRAVLKDDEVDALVAYVASLSGVSR
jgi:cytochrome c oxidase subunit 2